MAGVDITLVPLRLGRRQHQDLSCGISHLHAVDEVAPIWRLRHRYEFRDYHTPHSHAHHDRRGCVRAQAPGRAAAALRLVDTGTVAASAICIFEMTGHARTIMCRARPRPRRGPVVDVGAYRTWPEYTPISHALVTDYLGLPVHCYDPGDVPCAKFNIATEVGSDRKAGFATFVEEMMKRLVDAGARWFPNYELKAIAQASALADKQLTFGNGAQAVASKLILNMPQRPLLKVLRASSLPMGALDSGSFGALHTVATEIVTKVYLYYSDAWWVNDLGLTSGTFELSGDATEMELKGRYHDGDVKCDANGQNCHGFLQATYAHDFAGATSMYLRRFQNDRESPATIVGSADPEGANFLQHAHDRVVYYHKYVGAASDDRYTAFQVRNLHSQTSPPEFAVIAHWNIATPGAGGGWHGWTNLDHTDVALDPLGSYGIHLVNEAFSFVQGWAEGSLQQADTVLKDYFGVDQPSGELDVSSESARWCATQQWIVTQPQRRQAVARARVRARAAAEVAAAAAVHPLLHGQSAASAGQRQLAAARRPKGRPCVDRGRRWHRDRSAYPRGGRDDGGSGALHAARCTSRHHQSPCPRRLRVARDRRGARRRSSAGSVV